MRLDTLQQRIENAKAKITKKEATIIKKQALIEKKRDKLEKLGFDKDVEESDLYGQDEAFWTACEIGHLEEDIKRNAEEIEETKASLEKYEKQLAGEIEKESILLKEVPESMKRMQNELVKKWDAWDIERRAQIRKAHDELGYKEFIKKYSWADYEWTYSTDEQIHKANEQDAKVMTLNLYNRVKAITGEVTNWSAIRCEMGNIGPVLTGYVEGKEGRAEVETILAGGYNIQRLHIRTLVHER